MKTCALMLLCCWHASAFLGQNIPDYLPESGLVGWWPFTGNANDESGTGNDGTVINALPVADRFGNSNAAFSFNGENAIISCIYPGPIGVSDRSLSFWLKVDSLTNGDDNYFMTYGAGIGGGNGNSFTLAYNGVMCAGYGISYGGNLKKVAAIDSDYGEWVHYLITIDETSVYEVMFYRNGQLIAESCFVSPEIYPMNTTNEFPITFGGVYNAVESPVEYYFEGEMDDIGIWNRALSETEVQSIYSGSSLAVDQSSQARHIALRPNPAGDRIVVDITGENRGKTIIIRDAQARIVAEQCAQEFQNEIDLCGFEAGVYYISLNASALAPVRFVKL